MFNKNFEDQLKHYATEQEHQKAKKELVELEVNDKELILGVKESVLKDQEDLKRLKEMRASLTSPESIEKMEAEHGVSSREEVAVLVGKIDDLYNKLIERQKEGLELIRDHQELITQLRSQLAEIEASKDQFYEDMLIIINEDKRLHKNRV